jgi:hypothetical protein
VHDDQGKLNSIIFEEADSDGRSCDQGRCRS